ncbi:MAG: leucyl aminopeptidase family protein [Pseudobacteriovorax sp.]|nr:leucyl aminopeptidase family protein [Pseudobacteriovorax sp.]
MAVKNCRVSSLREQPNLESFDGILILLPAQTTPNSDSRNDLKAILGDDLVEAAMSLLKKTGKKAKPSDRITWDLDAEKRLSILWISKDAKAFQILTDCRKAAGDLLANKAKKLAVFCSGFEQDASILENAFAALYSHSYHFKKYGSKVETEEDLATVDLISNSNTPIPEGAGSSWLALNTEQSFVRDLVTRAGNDLTPKVYCDEVMSWAKSENISAEKFSYDQLKDMGAGAFIAVAQGSTHKQSAIIKLTHDSGKPGPKICYVGKGVTFDTGGNNLKPATSMFGMEGDMAGSAVALASFRLAVKENWSGHHSCYLAISDNLIGDLAYKPNDVITALNQKTIEIVHTDAEGRMLLADTLCLASREKPDLILDYASLTGACIRALGDGYSGVFCNRSEWNDSLIQAGMTSGERVWPFPLDEDYGESLKSDVADIKQCRLTGGADHIEAAYFLRQFLEGDCLWVHVDLAASHRPGGLAHVASDVTGFGVRFTQEFVSGFIMNSQS